MNEAETVTLPPWLLLIKEQAARGGDPAVMAKWIDDVIEVALAQRTALEDRRNWSSRLLTSGYRANQLWRDGIP